MYEIFKNAIAQMGAVGLLLAFAGLVMYRMWAVIEEKDKRIYEEAAKRELLLREVLENHKDTLLAIRDAFHADGLILARIEGVVEAIECKIDAKNNQRSDGKTR